MPKKNSKLFIDPGIWHPQTSDQIPFCDYINRCKALVTTHRTDLNSECKHIIEANCPYELRPSEPTKKGILLTHGLLDTPFLTKDIATVLHKQGWLVRSVLLPGHGTVPGALLNVTYEDWLSTFAWSVDSLRKEVDEVYLGGFSTGAILGLYHALQKPDKISGLIMLAPAFKIRSLFSFALNWNSRFNWKWKRAHWFYVGEEYDYTKYRSVPFNAVYQVYRLTVDLQKILKEKKLSLPLFIAMSHEDLIVSCQAAINYFLKNSCSESKFILYSAKKRLFKDSRIIFRSSRYPDWNIVSFSHISLPFSPHNPHYGMEGDYPFASHVEKEKNCIYGALDKPRKWLYDTLYKCKLTPYKHHRLTFNPDFDFMMEEMLGFIEKT